MINKEYLHSLGFTGFEHLLKGKRDGKDRLVWGGSLHNIGVMIMLVYNNNSWELEKLTLNDAKQMDNLKGYFSINLTIDEIIEAIRFHGVLGDISP